MQKLFPLILIPVVLYMVLVQGCVPGFGLKSKAEQVPEKSLEMLPELPGINRDLIEYASEYGDSIAPTYETAVCTQYLISVLEHFIKLTPKEKRAISITDHDTLELAIRADASHIRGIQTALAESKKGQPVENPNDVLPGDLVQFWNTWWGVPKGHCGIVLDLQPGRYITLISSSARTDGHGVQTYYWPEKAYFARLWPGKAKSGQKK